MTQLLDFPDELLCDVLSYLSPFDAIHAFYNLNARFNGLIEPFRTQIDLTHLSHRQSMEYITRYLPQLNRTEPLESLKLGNRFTPGQIQIFNRLFRDSNTRQYFQHLQSVTVESAQFEELNVFVTEFLRHLPRLKTFRLKIERVCDEQFQSWTKLIVNSILSISSFEKLSIDMPSGLVLARLSDRITFDRLKDVRLNVTLLTDLLLLLPRIPNVEQLFIRITWWASTDQTLKKMLEATPDDRSRLARVKNFRLTVESIIAFHFLHLEQLARRILNATTSRRFSFILKRCGISSESLGQLFNGERWERLLSNFSALTDFKLHLRSDAAIEPEQMNENLRSFDGPFFRQRRWTFSQWNASNRGPSLLFSTPYRYDLPFEMILSNDRPSQVLEKNFASCLSIEQPSNETCPLNHWTFHWILEQFPSLEELRLNCFQMSFSSLTPLNRPSLHRLHLEREQNVSLSDLLRLLPLINQLSLSYATVLHHNSTSDFRRYDRIVHLTVNGIPGEALPQTSSFFEQFPNLRFCHLQIPNRRTNDGTLLAHLSTIVGLFDQLIYLQVHLQRNVDETLDFCARIDGRIQTFLLNETFQGVLLHFWF